MTDLILSGKESTQNTLQAQNEAHPVHFNSKKPNTSTHNSDLSTNETKFHNP